MRARCSPAALQGAKKIPARALKNRFRKEKTEFEGRISKKCQKPGSSACILYQRYFFMLVFVS